MAGRQGILSVLGIAAVLVASWLTAGVASAAFPGDNGRIAYVQLPTGEADTEIFSSLPDGSDPQRLTDDQMQADSPAWSPDGQSIVFSTLDQRGEHIFRMDADGGELTLIGNGRAKASPAFSPNGRRIVYSKGRSIVITPSDGSGETRRLVRVEPRGMWLGGPEYSPRGKRIAFGGQPKGKDNYGIWSVRRDGSGLRRLTKPAKEGLNVGDYAPDYSPDGSMIAFYRTANGGGDSFIMRANGRHERRIPGPPATGLSYPNWAPEGDRLAITFGRASVTHCDDVYTIAPDGSDAQRVTNTCPPGGGFAFAPSWQPIVAAAP